MRKWAGVTRTCLFKKEKEKKNIVPVHAPGSSPVPGHSRGSSLITGHARGSSLIPGHACGASA